MTILVTQHAIDRFRERIPRRLTRARSDGEIASAIVESLQSDGCRTSFAQGHDCEKVRTRLPVPMRVLVHKRPEYIEVVTILRGEKRSGAACRRAKERRSA